MVQAATACLRGRLIIRGQIFTKAQAFHVFTPSPGGRRDKREPSQSM